MSLATLETRAPTVPAPLRTSPLVAAAVPGPARSGLVGADRDDRPGRPGDGRLLAGAAVTARAAGLAVAAVASLAVLLARVVLPIAMVDQAPHRRGDRGPIPAARPADPHGRAVCGPRPESRFDSEGATPSLVDALEDETEARAEPLPLDRIVPWRRARAVAVLAAMPVDRAPRRRGRRAGMADRAEPSLSEQPGIHKSDDHSGRLDGGSGRQRADRRGAGRPVTARGRALHSPRSTDRCGLAGDRDGDRRSGDRARRRSRSWRRSRPRWSIALSRGRPPARPIASTSAIRSSSSRSTWT